MNDDWWRGDDSIFNESAMDFILAVDGLNKAHRRLEANGDDPHVFIECAWWIGAATEACGRRNDGTVLEGFYWVRNKGFHETALAFGQVRPSISGTTGVAPTGIAPMGGASLPARWIRLEGPEDGSRSEYNKHLASRSIRETIDEALIALLRVFEAMRLDSGVTDLH